VVCQDLPAAPLRTARLDLEPLRVDHADEMAPLLDDPQLHTFIGGKPATLDQLRDRYGRLVVGRSPDGRQQWLNWVLRRLVDGRAAGTVQATVAEEAGRCVAEVAWIVATPYQGQGYAREASERLVRWLRTLAVAVIRAHVHPDHAASQAVARAVGMTPTTTVVDGEVRWEWVAAGDYP
jgi:RimJ/RimL family protein N-acetyltransferase